MTTDWAPLPRGTFTGIDWGPRDATSGYDPYLVWAECDRFAALGSKPPQWLPVAIELNPGVSIQQLVEAGSHAWLRVPPVYTSPVAPAGLRFCTARVGPAFFRALQPGGGLHALVQRLELGLATHVAQQEAEATPAPQTLRPAAAIARLHGKVFGLIDDSLAFANQRFLQANGEPRTAYFWRQDGQAAGRMPPGFGYGQELQAADIATAMDRHRYNGLVDESAVYVALGLSTLGRPWKKGRVPFHTLDLSASHGTHVADLACGPLTATAQIANLPPGYDAPPNWAQADDDASRCPMVAVQLGYETVKDTSGGSMNVHVLDGLMYILSRCADDAQVAVNVSFGTLAGPHDGTALLEAAMDELLSLCGPRLAIVLAAGNSYQLRGHANLALEPGQAQSLHWRLPPDDGTPSFLELWIEEGAGGVEFTVTPPGGRATLPARRMGESGIWADASGQPLCALIYPSAVATGRRGTCALLAVAPTFSFSPADTTAPAGVWTIAVNNQGARTAVIDAYVERDDVVAGTRSAARQSHLEDDPALEWFEQYDMQAWVDDPKRKTPIRRSGSFNSIATGAGTVSVGGRRVSDDSWALYSPRKPDPDAQRPQRPGVVKIPDAQACSDLNPVLTGLTAAGPRSGGYVRLAGTSDAAPQEARRRLNAMTGPRATSAPAASS